MSKIFRQNKENFVATGDDGVHNMRALDAAFASWQSGRREAV